MASAEYHDADERAAVQRVLWGAADRSGSGRSGPAGFGYDAGFFYEPDDTRGLFRTGSEQQLVFFDSDQCGGRRRTEQRKIRDAGARYVSRAGVQGL